MSTSRDLDRIVDEPCWCGARDVRISRRLQIKGGTKSCGDARCRPPTPEREMRSTSDEPEPKPSSQRGQPRAPRVAAEGGSKAVMSVTMDADDHATLKRWCQRNEYAVAQYVRKLVVEAIAREGMRDES